MPYEPTIGNRTLYGVQSTKNPQHVRVFIVDDNNEIKEVTERLAEFLGMKVTKTGYISSKLSGGSVIANIAEAYGMKCVDNWQHPYKDLF